MKKWIGWMVCLCFLSVKAQNEPMLMRKIAQSADCQQWVDSVMNGLSLKEKVAQLFIHTIAPLDTKANQANLRDAVEVNKVGGLLFSGGTVANQVLLTNRAQQMAEVPLLLTFDGEWGLSMRLKGTPSFPKNRVLGCIHDNRLIYEYGKEMARQCQLMGVQVNFAPVADVNINPHNPVINQRSFGENPQRVTEKVIAYAAGLEDGGVLSVSKHFPGHGDTNVDSHKALPILKFSRERLDSIELYPFKRVIEAGLGGIMVGHLHVPSIEPSDKLPASLSPRVVNGLLKDELGFRGLAFTDALAMKGVAGHRHVSLLALKAGNDMVLAPRNLKVEIAAVVAAIDKGEISLEEIEAKCRKVLSFKYALGLKRKPHIQLSGLEQRLNLPETQDLIRRLNQAAITVLSNRRQLLPFPVDKSREMALLVVGDEADFQPLVKALSAYTTVKCLSLKPQMPVAEMKQLRASLKKYHRVLVAVGEQRPAVYRSFFTDDFFQIPSTFLFFTPGKSLLSLSAAVKHAPAVVLAHSKAKEVQRQVAKILFAKAIANGRLSDSIGELFRAGAGVTLTPLTPLFFAPEEYGFSAAGLERVDSLILEGIAQGAFPGCQLVVLKEGHTLVDKTFGTQAGKDSPLVKPDNLYDLASLSKTTGTLLALMKLYDKGRFNLTDQVSTYLTFLQGTNKKDITIQELLFHQSGLPSGILFYQETIDPESYVGRLFAGRRDARHRVKVGATTWANPRFRFKKEWVTQTPKDDYPLQISDHLWASASFRRVMEQKIVEAPLRSKVYRYSDVGFVLLSWLVEELAQMPLDVYLEQEFYGPMGLAHTTYLPLRRFLKKQIVPSSTDLFLRKDTIQGFVHDETAAFQGGVSGNAGLFSTAREVAQIYQMLLDEGVWKGQRYLSAETCRLFTTKVSRISRRGLGFDKPDTRNPDRSPCGKRVSEKVYGHTGFTGTCAWVDPDHQLVFVFLCNRIFPDVTNNLLGKLELRGQIQDLLYDAMLK